MHILALSVFRLFYNFIYMEVDMQIGMLLRKGIHIGTLIQLTEESGVIYKFQYDDFYDDDELVQGLAVEDKCYYLKRMPDEMYDHLKQVDSLTLSNIRRKNQSDFELWLLCCDQQLIPDTKGYRM